MPLWKTRFKKSGNKQQPPVQNGKADVSNGTSACQGPSTLDQTEPVLPPCNRVDVTKNANKSTTECSNGAEKGAELLVVVKDFKGSNKKEMTVHRGQVVQRIYSCGTWLSVQNVDGQTGYIPSEVCCPKDEVEDSTWCELNKDQPNNSDSTDGIYENIIDTQEERPKAFPYNSMSSTPSVSLSNHSARSALQSTDTPHANGGPQRVPVRKISAPSLGTLEISNSPPIPRYSIEHILHPLHPLSITRSHMSSDTQTSSCRRKHSSESDSVPPSTPAAQPLSAHNRNDSYLEAVIEEDNNRPNLPKITVRHPSRRPLRPSDLPMLPIHRNLSDRAQRMDTPLTSNGGTVTAQHMLESSQMSNLVDDVFLPTGPKPLGIFQVVKPYEKQAEGEVTVTQDEYVIVTDMEFGEWASIMTSSGTEGIVPKGILARYSPSAKTSVSIGTQTELIIMAPVVHQQSSTSSSSSASSRQDREVVCIRDIRRSSTPKKHGTEMAVQTDYHMSYPYPLDDFWDDSQMDDPWYENSMSIPRLPSNSFYTSDTPSICTLPSFNGRVHERGVAPLAFHSSRQSLPQFPMRRLNGLNGTLTRRNPPSEPHTPRGLQGRTLKEQNDWPMSPGLFSDFSEFSGSPKSPQMIMLTAIKDYSPDIDGTDYLTLQKGDTLHLIPGNNAYKGWLWVYHVRRRCYGYVPRSLTAYINTTDTRLKNGITRYDEV